MALTANTLPSVVPNYSVPYDASLDLTGGSAATLTATGYLNGTTNLDIGPGRVTGLWALDISALDVSSSDEVYKLHLMGSNDAAWGNGNVELLAFHDFAAVTAGRQVATILGASPAIPATGLVGTEIAIPFSNLMQRIVYRYLRAYLVASGTTPSITLRSWIAPVEMKI